MTNLSVLRGAEFECVKQYFQPGVRVLEIGGGNGYQASLIAALGAMYLVVRRALAHILGSATRIYVTRIR